MSVGELTNPELMVQYGYIRKPNLLEIGDPKNRNPSPSWGLSLYS